MKITIKDDVYNKSYLPYLNDFRKFQIYYGGAGSGKSDFIAAKSLYYFMSIKGNNGMVVRNTGADNHDSTFALYNQIINRYNLGAYFDINKSRGAEVIRFIGNNNHIIFKGLDDVEKRKGVTFPNGILQWIWVEEVNEVSESKINQLDIRLRGKTKIPKIFYMSFNPVDENSWLKRRFFDIPMESQDGFTFKSTYKDNEFLTDEDKASLEKYKTIDEYYYQVYCLGNWGSISKAKVFYNIVVEYFDIDDRLEQQFQNIRYGMDFGFVHASTLMSMGFIDGDLYIFSENYYKEHTNGQFIKKVDKSGFKMDNLIIADSAEPDRIKEWNMAGYRVSGAAKGKNSLQDGVDYLQNIPKIHIHKSNCPNAAREFLGFKRRELKDGTITEQFVELDDDTIAGVRYGIEDIRLMLSTKIEKQQTKHRPVTAGMRGRKF